MRRRTTAAWFTAAAPLAGAAAVSLVTPSWTAILTVAVAAPFVALWSRVDHDARLFCQASVLWLTAAAAAWAPAPFPWSGTAAAGTVRNGALALFACGWWAATLYVFHDKDQQEEEPEDEAPEPPRRVVIDRTKAARQPPPPPTLEERTRSVRLDPRYAHVDITEGTVSGEPDDGDSFAAELRSVWPQDRRGDDGKVSVADLARLLGIDASEVRRRCELEELPVERVPVRSLNGARGSGPRAALAWPAIRPGSCNTARYTPDRGTDLHV